MLIYVMVHILLSSEMCSASLEKSRKLIKLHCCDREQQCLLPFYSQTQTLEVWDMYGLTLYSLNKLTSHSFVSFIENDHLAGHTSIHSCI